LRRIAAGVTLVCVGVLGSRPALAEPQIVGLLDVRGDGVSNVVLATFSEAVEEGLAGADDFQPASKVRMHEMLAASSWSSGCIVGPCLAEVRAQTDAGYVVIAGVTGSGESYRFTVTLIETGKGQVVDQRSESCPACTVEDLSSAATLATIELINSVDVTAVTDDSARAAENVVLRGRVHRHARLVRRAGVLVLGLGLLTAAGAAYFVHKDDLDVGYPLLGATAGLAVSGAVMLGLSFQF
jgi:hypothetical protein